MVWAGVLPAVALSLFAGAALQLMAAEFPQKAQELFEAIVGFVAVIVLVSMVFWMRRAARSIKGELHGAIDAAMQAPKGATWALIGMTFFAVGREGLESVFFLLAVFQQSSRCRCAAWSPAWTAGRGRPRLSALYRGGIRLDLRRFFRWTGVFILIVAAGLAAASLRSLHEAGVWNLLQARVYDLSSTLPVSSVLGTVLSGVFNYQEAPTIGEAGLYVIFRGDAGAVPEARPTDPSGLRSPGPKRGKDVFA